jgi:hypothetical protein
VCHPTKIEAVEWTIQVVPALIDRWMDHSTKIEPNRDPRPAFLRRMVDLWATGGAKRASSLTLANVERR